MSYEPISPRILGIEQGGIMYSDDGGQIWLDHPQNAVKDGDHH